MKLVKENLGKASVTVEGFWSKKECYDRISIVTDATNENWLRTYISKRPVPAGVDINDTSYWLPFSPFVPCICMRDIDDVVSGKYPTPTKDWCHPDIVPEPIPEPEPGDGCDCEAIPNEKIDDIIGDSNECDCQALSEQSVEDILNGKEVIEDNTPCSCGCCDDIPDNEVIAIINGEQITDDSEDCKCGCDSIKSDSLNDLLN